MIYTEPEMPKKRQNCEHRERCGRTGHYFVEGVPVPCPCLLEDKRKTTLGAFNCSDPLMDSPLIRQREKNLLILTPLDEIRPHVAGTLLEMDRRDETFEAIDAYRLLEIFLEKDEQFETQHPIVGKDLLILLIGFGDPRNRYLPELLLQILSRREVQSKPTWVIMGSPFEQVPTKYSQAIYDKLQTFKKVRS